MVDANIIIKFGEETFIKMQKYRMDKNTFLLRKLQRKYKNNSVLFFKIKKYYFNPLFISYYKIISKYYFIMRCITSQQIKILFAVFILTNDGCSHSALRYQSGNKCSPNNFKVGTCRCSLFWFRYLNFQCI